GYPRALGRDAQSAVACGLEIARTIEAAASGAGSAGASVAVRIGIETGLVVAGRVGPSLVSDVDGLVGPPPNAASRLQHLAPPNGVVIGEAIFDLVRGEFLCEGMPIAEPAPDSLLPRAFLVQGESARRERFPLVTQRAPLVGRHAELAL